MIGDRFPEFPLGRLTAFTFVAFVAAFLSAPSMASGLHGKTREYLLLPSDTPSASRTYVVRTIRTADVQEDESSTPEDQEESRTIQVRRLTPSPSEVGRSRSLSKSSPSPQKTRGADEPLPLLLKTRTDADGHRVPEVAGDEPEKRTRSAVGKREASATKVVVRSAPTRSTYRVVTRNPAPTRVVTRSAPVLVREVRAAEPTTIVVRETTVTTTPVTIVKKACRWLP